MFDSRTVPLVVSLPSFREVLAVASRRKFVLLLALVLPMAASLALAFHMTPKFQADSKVLVRTGREYQSQVEVATGSAEMGPTTTMLDTINTEIEILTSDDLIREVLRKETIARLYPDLVRDPPAGLPIEDAAAKAFRNDLRVAPVKLSNVIAIGLRSYDPWAATETLRLLLAGFQQRHVEAFRSDRSPLLDGQLQDKLTQLSALESERAAYKAAKGLYSAAEQRSMLIQKRAKNIQELQDVEIRQQTLAAQVAFFNEEIAKQPARIVVQGTTRESEVAQDNQRHLRDVQQQARELRARYPEGSPMLASIEAGLSAAQQFDARTRPKSSTVEVGINPILPPLTTQRVTAGSELAPLADKIAALRKAVADDDASLARLSQEEVRLGDLDRQIDQLDKASSALRQRLDDARYLDNLDRAKVASLRVIQQPVALDKPVFPSKLLFLAAGAVVSAFAFGLVLLLGLTFGLRVMVADTVERVLGVPVVAALPDVPRRRMRRIAALARRQPTIVFADR